MKLVDRLFPRTIVLNKGFIPIWVEYPAACCGSDFVFGYSMIPRLLAAGQFIVADGDTREIFQDEKFLNEHGLKKA